MSDQGDPSRADHSGVRKTEVAAVVALLSVLFAEVFYLLVLHEGPGYPTVAAETGTQSDGPTQPSDVPTDSGTPTEDETAEPSEVGEPRSADNADTTLLRARKVHPPASRAPSAGEEWFGVRARTCLDPDARPSGGLPWSSWAATDAAGNRYLGSEPPWDDYPSQQLSTTGLQPGDCHIGWVLIALPQGTGKRIETVLFRPKAPTPAQWAV